MKGSNVKNVKFNPNKEKLTSCIVCGKPIVIGKFAKKDQKCQVCMNIPKGKDAVKVVKAPDPNSFGARLNELAIKLGFEITDKRIWRKKYAIDGGGVTTIHIMVAPGMVGEQPKLSYFSMVVQRAIDLHEDFRKFMPVDAASDCELLTTELGDTKVVRPQIGQERCAACGALTDEFGVDTKRNRVLCIRPNQCFKRLFTSGGAEADA